jgi:hypothetical protein
MGDARRSYTYVPSIEDLFRDLEGLSKTTKIYTMIVLQADIRTWTYEARTLTTAL